MKLTEFINYFNSIKCTNGIQYMAKCPCHNDKKASLSITQKDNKILLHCFAGCDTKTIINSIGLSMKDLYVKEKEKKMEVLENEYIYTNEEGHPLYKAIKYRNLQDNTKKFQLAQFCDNKWVYNMSNVKRVLYNLPNVIKSDTIYFVEGEKDADNLNKIGLVSTTTAQGASSFNRFAIDYTKSLEDKLVYIIPDNDDAGRKYAKDVYTAIYKVAKKVQILNLVDEIPNLKEKGDISDVLSEYGKEKTLEIIEKLKAKNSESISSIYSSEDLNKDCSKFVTFDAKTLSKEKLLDKSIFNYLLSIEDEFERAKTISELEIRAKELNCLPTFKNVLKLYKQKIKKLSKNEILQHNDVAEMLLQENSLAIYENNLYIYENGFYNMDKKAIERKIVELTPSANSRFRNEVYSYLELKDDIHMNINKESDIINFKNGLYNIKERKLYNHSPDFFSINQIHTNYNEEAEPVAEVDDFLDKISNYNTKRKQAILEMIGYCMTTSIKYQKIFILYGETARNGKSTLLSVISKLIGKNNIGNVSFNDICTNRFAGCGIQGKLLNINSEMTNESVKDISFLKALTGGDDVEIEKKFKDRQTISPYAKFVFCANSLPNVVDKTNGFYRRLHIITFEKSFTDDEVNQFDINKILTTSALEYLAKISLQAYISMNKYFSNHEESEREVSKYKIHCDTILSFINNNNSLISKFSKAIPPPSAKTTFEIYKKYCIANNLVPLGKNKFHEEIEKIDIVTVKYISHQKYYIFKKLP